MNNIDKDKFVFVNRDNIITDVPFESKEIGFYQDAWNRFKKDKASFVAFIIISIILFFVLVGPFMKKYDLPKRDIAASTNMSNLPPKVPLLEKIGIFQGHKTITRGKRFLTDMYNSDFGEKIILSGFPEELAQDPNHPNFEGITEITVRVDMYEYKNYISSYKNENNSTDTIKVIMTQSQFDEAIGRNTVLDVLEISESVDLYGNITYQYHVLIDQFKHYLNQTPEDTYFWFGTDDIGRDLFTELWTGSRISILVAVFVVVINAVIGLFLGSLAGYYGGTFDLIVDRLVDIISSIPFIAVVTILVAAYGSAMWVIVLSFTMTGWIGSYGSGRIQFYRFKNREYVFAAKTLGAKDSRIMFKHIFPNALGILITSFVLSIPSFIISEATYSFLGIINYGNASGVGMLIDSGQKVMRAYPHLLLFPTAYISIMMIAFNLFGNGLRDAFNPSLRGAE